MLTVAISVLFGIVALMALYQIGLAVIAGAERARTLLAELSARDQDRPATAPAIRRAAAGERRARLAAA